MILVEFGNKFKICRIDELNTPQIIINNERLQHFHKYNLLIPALTEGFYNLQEERDNVMISNTTQDLELNINDTYFSIDASNNLTLNNNFWEKRY